MFMFFFENAQVLHSCDWIQWLPLADIVSLYDFKRYFCCVMFDTNIEKQETALLLPADKLIACVENPKYATGKPLESIA